MAAKVNRGLMALGFVLFLEAAPAIGASVLLLLLVCTSFQVRNYMILFWDWNTCVLAFRIFGVSWDSTRK
jgi:hypothetical protein